MKSRLWVLILFLLFLFGIGGFLGAHKWFQLNERARKLISRTITEQTGLDFTSESCSMRLWSIRFNDVTIRLSALPLAIAIRQVRINYGLLAFLFGDFQPIASIQELYLEQPVISYDLGDGTETVQDFLNAGPGISFFDKLPSVRVSIANGSMVFRRGESSLVFADEISGWFGENPSSPENFSVQGKVLSDSLNTTCRGVLPRNGGRLALDIASTGCDLASENMEVVSGDIDPRSGTLAITLHAEMADSALTISGEYRIDNGSFLLKTLDIGATDIAIRGHFTQDDILFDSVSGMVAGMKPEVSGSIHLRPEPVVELQADAKQVQLAEPFNILFPGAGELPQGSLSFSAHVQGPLWNLACTAAVLVDSLRYGRVRMDDVLLDAVVTEQGLNLEKVSGRIGEYTFSGNGRFPEIFREKPGVFTVSTDILRAGDPSWQTRITLSGRGDTKTKSYDVTAAVAHQGESSWQADLHCLGTADIGNSEYDAQFELKSGRLLMPVSGLIGYHDGVLNYSCGDSSLSFTGYARDLFDNLTMRSEVTFANLPLFSYFGQPGRDLFLNGSGVLQGNPAELVFESDTAIRWGQNLNSRFTGTAEIRNILEDVRTVSLKGQLTDHHIFLSPALTWDVTLSAGRERIAASLSDSSGAALDLGISPETGALSGRLDLKEYPLESIIDIFVQQEFGERGKITGTAEVGGTIRNPSFETRAPVQFTGMRLVGIERLDGTGNVSGGFDTLHFQNILVRRDGIPVATADGVWTRGTPFVLKASGKAAELGAIGDIIDPNRKTDGRADYALTMEFTQKSGTVDGEFSIADGHFMDISFDLASARFYGGSAGFFVEDFKVAREGVYSGYGRASSGYFWKDSGESHGLRMNLSLSGDLVRALPSLTPALKSATGDCTADLTIGGTWVEPIALGGEITVRKAVAKPAFLIDTVDDISAVLRIEPDIQTGSGFLAVKIVEASGMVGDRKLQVRTVHPADSLWAEASRPEMATIQNSILNLDFGVLAAWIEPEKSGGSSLQLFVPGFMAENRTATFEITGQNSNRFYVGAYEGEKGLTPYVQGRVNVLSGDVYYPLLPMKAENGAEPDVLFLNDMYWDIEVGAGSTVNYVNEHNFTLGRFAGTTLWQNEIKINENSSFAVIGCLADNTFRVTGRVESVSGNVIYYGSRFDVEFVELELDTANLSKPAMITGRARTTVYDDSLGTENEIYIHVDFVDRISGAVTEARGDYTVLDTGYRNQNRPQTRFDAGELGIIEIRFTSNNPSDDTQEKIMARLGFSPSNIGAAATRALTAGIDNYYLNPLLRPFEERLKRIFRLDMVRITPAILGSFAQRQLSSANDVYLGADMHNIERSRVMLGEYLGKNWFFSYTGQYGFSQDYLFSKERGFLHDFGLQYNVEWNLRFQGRYIYDEIIKRDDARVEVRYDFLFD